MGHCTSPALFQSATCSFCIDQSLLILSMSWFLFWWLVFLLLECNTCWQWVLTYQVGCWIPQASSCCWAMIPLQLIRHTAWVSRWPALSNIKWLTCSPVAFNYKMVLRSVLHWITNRSHICSSDPSFRVLILTLGHVPDERRDSPLSARGLVLHLDIPNLLLEPGFCIQAILLVAHRHVANMLGRARLLLTQVIHFLFTLALDFYMQHNSFPPRTSSTTVGKCYFSPIPLLLAVLWMHAGCLSLLSWQSITWYRRFASPLPCSSGAVFLTDCQLYM